MSNNNLDNLRHSCAHLLAAAVMELWPQTLRTIGPAIENGFYFDFDFGDAKVSEADFPVIEAKMKELVKSWKGFVGREVLVADAKKLYEGNPYKVELIEEFSSGGQLLTVYRSGDYEDLCRGGHCAHPNNDLKHFKLLSVAGAYWRGSEKNKMLTRIYATCFPKAIELETYLKQLEEAKLRDHKKLGIELDLFTFSQLVGGGLPLWTPKGTLVRETLNDFVWELRKEKGYQKVEIPHITKKDLYQTSGHWDKFKDELFRITTRENHEFAMKPMNCPHHTQIFARRPHSYKDMPQRYANTTMVYRDEQSGELSGLSRVRSITQDDAHVFCRKKQIETEMFNCWDIVDTFYKSAGFDLKVRLSLHDPNSPEKYLGKPEDWVEAENKLRDLAKIRNVEVYEGIGEAAFYGPKLDFMTRDSIGREWQVATIQLDLNMPNRFGLSCINEKGEKENIIMIHCAVMGSIERYLSILIEHFAGAFPTWLSPIQVVILPISDKHTDYAKSIESRLKSSAIRCEINDKNEPLNARVRDSKINKIPYILVVGVKEIENNTVSVSKRGQKDSYFQDSSDFVNSIQKEISSKSLDIAKTTTPDN